MDVIYFLETLLALREDAIHIQSWPVERLIVFLRDKDMDTASP